MTIPDDPWWLEFIAADPPHTAKLATVRADGRPHVAPIWVAVDGSQLLFNTGADTLKGKSLRRDPRVSLCFDDERPPFAFVIVEGTAELIEDLDEVRRWAAFIGGRYMGADRAEEFGARNGVPGEYLVRVTPTHVAVARDVSD
jgi:PPOX class probable F420-dependent enzyme